MPTDLLNDIRKRRISVEDIENNRAIDPFDKEKLNKKENKKEIPKSISKNIEKSLPFFI